MKKKKELKYLNKLFKKMRQHFKSFALTQNAEALHGFRVQVKKIKSFLTLLEAGEKNDKLLKTFKPVKKIFVDGGFSKNDVYMNLLAAAFPHIEVYSATVAQASALGAAIAIRKACKNSTLPSDLITVKRYEPTYDIVL